MLYQFVERFDNSVAVVAQADVNNGVIIWTGSQVEEIKNLLIDTRWHQLNNGAFNENNPKHWLKLPELLTGSRLWVESPSIQRKQKEPDTRLRTASSRLPMWINRYTEVVNTAKTMACANQKLVWTLGPTEHCSSCLKLAGKVKRGKFWQESGVLPQSRQLECGGFRCQCSLQPTDAPLSRGSLPRLP